MAYATKTMLRPLHDRILVKRTDEATARQNGLIIPDTAQEKPQEGRVVAVGPGKVTDEGKKTTFAVREGDRILFAKHSGNEIKLNGEEHLIMTEEDVLGILTSEPAA